MSHVDELVREFRGYVPAPGAEAAAAVAAGIRGAPARSAPGRRRRLLPALGGGAAVASLAVVAGLLFVNGPGRVGPTGAPRVGWGMTATVRVTPDPGVSQAVAMDRAVDALVARAIQRDIAGFNAVPVDDGTLQLTVPGARQPFVIQELLQFRRFKVYDADTDTVAVWRTAGDVRSGVGAIDGTPAGWLIVPERGPLSLPAFAATTEEADRILKRRSSTNPPPVVASVKVPVPGAIRIVGRHEGPVDQLTVLDDAPIATRADVGEIRIDGAQIHLRLAPAAVEQIRRVTAGRAAVVYDRDGPVGTQPGPMELVGDELVVTTQADFVAQQFLRETGTQTPAGVMAIQSSQPYGTEPPLVGDVVAPLPAPIEELRHQVPQLGTPVPQEIAASSIVRVLSVQDDQRTRELYVGRTPEGNHIAWEHPGGGVSSGVCDFEAGPPILQQCGGTGRGELITYFGRVWDARIVTVELRREDGSIFRTTPQNGWFLLAVHGPIEPLKSGTMYALDRDGNEVRGLSSSGGP